MTDEEIKRFFDYVESRSECDGVITKEDIYKAVGVDLDGDQVVSEKPLFVKKSTDISKHTGKHINTYTYSTEPGDGFEPYMITFQNGDRVQATEQLITQQNNREWLKDFEHVLDDQRITFQEFKDTLRQRP